MAPPHWMHVSALSAEALQQFADLQEFAFAEIDGEGRVRSMNPFAKLCWGWNEGSALPEDVQFLLRELAPEASQSLPLKKGGLFLHGVRLPANSGWVLVGYEQDEAAEAPAQPDDLGALLDRLPVMVLRLQTDGTVRFCNKETLRRTGFERDSIIDSRFLSRIVLPEHLSSVEQAIRQVSSTESGSLDFQYRTRRGKVVSASLHLSFTEAYDVEAVILDRIAGPEDAHPLLSAATDQSPIGMILIDDAASIQYLNNRLREFVGITTAAAWQERVVDEAAGFDGRLVGSIRTCLRTGEAAHGIEATFETASGAILRARTTVTPVYRDARRAGCALLMEPAAGSDAFTDPSSRFETAAATLREVATAAPDETLFLDSACRIMGEATGADRVRILLSDPSATDPFTRAAWVTGTARGNQRNGRQEGDREVLITMGPGSDLYVGPEDDADAAAMASVIDIREAYWVRLQRSGGLDAFVALERVPGDSDSDSAWTTRDRQHVRRLIEVLETLWSWIEVGSRYRMVTASISDALFGFTFAEDGRRRYLFATEQMAKIAEHAPGELTDLHASGIDWIEDVVYAEDRPIVRAHDRTLEQGHESTISYRIRLADGTTRWVMEQAAPHPDPTGFQAVSGILTDITERKAAEGTLLEAKSAAEQANRQKTGFIGTLSHEIRTPLGAVNGFAQLLEREIADYEDENGTKLPAQIHEFIEAISDRSSRLQTLVHDLFELSNIEMGQVQLQRVPVAVHGTIRQSAQKVADDLRRKRIKMRLQLDSRDPKILGDPRRVAQVLDGLISNAVKFTETGSITVRTQAGMREVLIEVRDTGIGIDPSFQKDLFQPFTQEDDWMNRRYEGTGLGLGLVKRLLDLQGGRIEVESEKDKGSSFRVYLPAVRGATARRQLRRADRPGS